ncbi:hypothetical protein IJ182_11420 [bacterium]|nr:hypothetical protein [bacterium]
MAYKVIDCKNKEIYYYSALQPALEEQSQISARFTFWARMENIAMQNMMIQQRKMEA